MKTFFYLMKRNYICSGFGTIFVLKDIEVFFIG